MHIEFKDEDEAEDGMPVGPVWLVSDDGRAPVYTLTDNGTEAGDGKLQPWFRKDGVLQYGRSRGLEVEEV